MAHPPPSPITHVGLAGDLTDAGTRHLTTGRLFQAPIGQIGPTSVTPYLRPCYATIPTTQNQTTDEEPPSESPAVGSYRRGRTVVPPDAITPPLAAVWARAHDVTPRAVPRRGPSWADHRAGARAPSAWPNSPPPPPRAQLTRKTLFLFFFLFLHICIYIDILCTKNSPNILYDTKQ
jgi:hypothetical protein